jgi:ectoine hydroxylase-related dioxygenase (phytanoyl-CoA dioxygenase family)
MTYYKDLLKQYERDGYIVLKNVIDKNECNRLINETIKPVLSRHKISLINKKTWNKQQGMTISNNNGHAISRKNKDFRWKALFDSKKLNSFIDKLHVRNKWKWIYSASEGLGWIHLRFPYTKSSKSKSLKLPKKSFHLDGTYDTLNKDNKVINLINIDQSNVILPFITTVKQCEGGTVVIPGSHKYINDYIHRNITKNNKECVYEYIDKITDKNKSKYIDVQGEQGDILIMHPHLIHSSSLANNKSNVRITFNLAVGNL